MEFRLQAEGCKAQGFRLKAELHAMARLSTIAPLP